jgi:hypothetical protein
MQHDARNAQSMLWLRTIIARTKKIITAMHAARIDDCSCALKTPPCQKLEGNMARDVQVMTVALVFLFLGAFVIGSI